MTAGRIIVRKLITTIQSILILGVMTAIFAVIGLMVAGATGLMVAVAAGIILFLLSPRLSPGMVLRMYHAGRIPPEQAPALYRILARLSGAAGVSVVPGLYYVPSSIMNAFSVGRKKNAAIALTDGLLRDMNGREITGILAHEMSHIEHNDLWIMGMADSISRFINIFSMLGIFILILYIPAVFLGGMEISPWPLLVIFLAPHAAVFLQLALSRTREYDADVNAVRLTGDPLGLASALEKIDQYPLRIWDFLLFPGRKVPAPSVLRTHPDTRKRIRILLELAENYKNRAQTELEQKGDGSIIEGNLNTVERKPRWHISGIWH